MMRVRRVCLVLLLALIGTPLFAQQSPATTAGLLAGSVLDPDGKVVQDATLLIRNEATGELRTTSTDAGGRFSVSGLTPGSYTVEVAVPGFDLVRRNGIAVGSSTPEVVIKLSIANISESVTVSAALPAAAVAAPSQGSLTARSAQSLISSEFVRNYTSPFSDYSQVLQMAPGTFSASSNGPGLADTKTFYRGFKDGQYSMTFDGIPFNDTNDPTHHSWVFFPAQTIGSTVFDRSPGSAATIGPSTYGGSVNLLSRSLPQQQTLNGTISYGSFDTQLYDVEFESGPIGNSRFLIEGHRMTSDGYQTYNSQDRKAFSAKYLYTESANTQINAFVSLMQLNSNTPNQKGSTRAQYAQFGDNFLMTNDPASPLYYGYNFYNIPTNFEYFGYRTMWGNWSLDDKFYGMGYHNKQNYNSTTTISTTSATDKLNSYWKVGNNLPLSYVRNWGVFRSGLWTEYASTDRYQIPSDPRTWVDAALPNFHEQFTTKTVQPYAEVEWRAMSNLSITPGIKYAAYTQDFTHYPDNGKTVGDLGGAPYVKHAVTYNTWLPSIDAHYLIQPTWSTYVQFGKGQNIPPTSIFDVKGAQVATVPEPILTATFQVGSVWKARRATLDVNFYRIRFQNDYSSTIDPVTGDVHYYLSSDSRTQGIEAESTILVGGGVAVYLNATSGSARYLDTHQWVQNAPSDTETIGLTYNRGSWNVGFFSKRVGQMYNDNGATHEAVVIDPFNLTNLFFNYTLRGMSRLSPSRLRFALNNLTDSHAIIGVTPAKTTTSVASPADVLALMAGRSVSVSFTIGVAMR